VLLFAISFSAVEGYLFRNAGYPPTFGSPQSGVTLSYPSILNASLTEIVQNIKDAPAFKLLMLEYPNEVRIETIKLSTTFGSGSIEVHFYQESSKLGFNFFSSGGSYHVSVSPLLGTSLHPMFPRYQSQDVLLKQVDDLGLQWYYDVAVEAYQNTTGADLEVNDLIITIQSVNHSNYPGGIQLHILGMHKDGSHSNFAFSAYFHPNGTLVEGFNVR
jgi:hypothetical protein